MRKTILFWLFQIVLITALMAKQPMAVITDSTAINNSFDTYFIFRESNPSKALEALQDGIIVAARGKNQNSLAVLLYHKGYLLRVLGLNNQALQCDLEAIAIFDKLSEQNVRSWVLTDIGMLYLNNERNFKMAFDHFEKALEAFTKIKNKSGIIATNSLLGETYLSLRQYDKAISYFQMSAQQSEEINDTINLALAHMFMGKTYILTNNFVEAQKHLNSSNLLNSKFNYYKGVGDVYQNYAALSMAKQQYDSTLLNCDKALNIYISISNKAAISEVFTTMSAVYAKQNDINKAILYANKGLQVADSSNIVSSQMIILPILARYYTQLGLSEKSYDCLKRINDIQESETSKKFKQLESEYSFQLNMKEKKLQETIQRKQNLIITILIGGLILFVFLIVRIYLKNRELKKSYAYLFKNSIKEKELAELKKQMRSNRIVLKSEQNQGLLDELLDLMNIEKIYLKSDLTLEDLAKQLNSNRTYISQLINENFNTNFSNFINEYRVKDAQQILLDSPSKIFTIETIAEKVGFNSKSAFNIAFRKFTGLTPSNFYKMKSYQNEEE